MEFVPRTAADLARHAASIRRVAGALVRDAADVEDVSQEALRAALESPGAAQRSPGGWLAGAGRRLAAVRVRGETRRRARECEVARLEAQPSAGEYAAELEVAERLVALVRALPDSQAEVVWLRFWEDLPPREIAARLGVGVEAVKTRLKRGLVRLRGELDAATPGGREAWLSALAPFVRVPFTGAPPTVAETFSAASSSSPVMAGLPLWMLVKKLALVVLVAASIVVGSLLLDRLEREPAPLAAPAPGQEAPVLVRAGSDSPVGAAGLSEREIVIDEGPSVASPRLVVRVVREFDGSPLPGVRVAAIDRERHALASVGRAARTDLAGRVVFNDLGMGPVRLITDRGARLDLELTEPRLTEVELAVPLGIRLKGVVLDPDGLPLSDAEVFLQRRLIVSDWTDVARVAKTGSDGGFELLDVSPEAGIGARASSFAPSDVDDLRHRVLAPGDELELVLQLAPGGGVARGVVVGPGEVPIQGAWVWIEQRSRRRGQSVPGIPTATVWLGVTDADGAFERDDFELGPAQVVVASSGFARLSTSIEVQDAQAAPTELRLSRPCGIDGRVVGTDGRGLAGVSVRVERVGFRSAQEYEPLGFPRVETDADGGFRFEDLPSGRAVLAGVTRDRAKLAAEVQLVAGERAVAELRALDGLELVGRAIEPDGTPIERAMILVESPNGWKGSRSTDVEGRFRFEGVPDASLSVHLYPVEQGWHLPAVSMQAVRASDSPIELVWESVDAAGKVHGRFVDPAEWIQPGDRVVAELVLGDKYSKEAEIEITDGRFRFDEVPAGEGYRVVVSTRDEPVLASELFAVVAGQELELPELRTAVPAKVRLELASGCAEARAYATLIDEKRGLRRRLIAEDGVLMDDRVPAGDWYLTVEVEGFAADGFQLHLAAGASWERGYVCTPALAVRLRLGLPASPARVEVRISDEEGRRLVDCSAMFGRTTSMASVHLRPGIYRIEVHDPARAWGGVGEFEVPLAGMTDEPQEIAVPLAPR